MIGETLPLSASDIFFSYVREDQARVALMVTALEARGWSVFWDRRIPAGKSWRGHIGQALEQARCVVVAWSKHSIKSEWVIEEADDGRERGILVPMFLDPVRPPRGFRGIQGADLSDWSPEQPSPAFDSFLADLSAMLGSAPQEAGTVLRDVNEPWCPELVVIPSGTFTMGSTEPERRWAIRHGAQREWVKWEKPQHRVEIPKAFAVGKHPVTRGQFARFEAAATDHDMSGGALVYIGNEWKRDASADWCFPGFEQTDQHPVVCVSWQDAQAYIQWLSKETSQPYRLLSEAEWEYACRAGTTTRYHWGDGKPSDEQANFDQNVGKTTEVGSYPANPWGLHDMHGNVWEWVEDCWHESYEGAPSDGSTWTSGDCSRRVLRGGSWDGVPGDLRSASRIRDNFGSRNSNLGFRVARTLR